MTGFNNNPGNRYGIETAMLEQPSIDTSEYPTLELVHPGHDSLKQVSKEVPLKQSVKITVQMMVNTMIANNGQGLAANQFGLKIRIFVMSVDGFSQVFINPTITKRYGGQSKKIESCLSFPGKQVKVKRYKRIDIEGYDEHWNKVSFKLRGRAAIVAQHEMDHLNGVVI